eukprot:TRINITY_DN49226_c0_g1_i1.p1 TRINITY_DN49226_c0_g1~~TRINITY_DN49226_c0_g1_i1.p1  ORF type:complete len:158 (-),score=44.02 TRINITY_DN49226_c0_g1_i1:211-684(-)
MQQQQTLKQQLMRLDLNHNGGVSPDALKHLLSRMGLVSQDIAVILETAEKNSFGAVRVDTFVEQLFQSPTAKQVGAVESMSADIDGPSGVGDTTSTSTAAVEPNGVKAAAKSSPAKKMGGMLLKGLKTGALQKAVDSMPEDIDGPSDGAAASTPQKK